MTYVKSHILALEHHIEYLKEQIKYERREKEELQRKLDKVLQISNEVEDDKPYKSGIRAVGRSASARIRSLIEDDEVPEDQDIHPSDFLEP